MATNNMPLHIQPNRNGLAPFEANILAGMAKFKFDFEDLAIEVLSLKAKVAVLSGENVLLKIDLLHNKKDILMSKIAQREMAQTIGKLASALEAKQDKPVTPAAVAPNNDTESTSAIEERNANETAAAIQPEDNNQEPQRPKSNYVTSYYYQNYNYKRHNKK